MRLRDRAAQRRGGDARRGHPDAVRRAVEVGMAASHHEARSRRHGARPKGRHGRVRSALAAASATRCCAECPVEVQRARSSASPGCSAPGAASCYAPSPGPTRSTRVTSTCSGRAAACALSAAGHRRRGGADPRGPPQPGRPARAVGPGEPDHDPASVPSAVGCGCARRRRMAVEAIERFGIRCPCPDVARFDPLRRQPAEGHPRPVADDRAQPSCCSTSRPPASTSWPRPS